MNKSDGRHADQPDGSYADKKAFFERVLTVYGRKPALEALSDDSLDCHRLHLAQSNRSGGIIEQLLSTAQARGVPVSYHAREALARISKNGKQDQGVALDILCPAFRQLDDYLAALPSLPRQRILALDGITNPQNLGMILRSAAAGEIDAVLWSRRGNAALGPLVIKASSGTLYRAPLVFCQNLPEALAACRAAGIEVLTLRADAGRNLFGYRPATHAIYVLGNETSGVSKEVAAQADAGLAIPMGRGVESLNVAVTAALIAYAETAAGGQ
ncbi:RNA methyltransferase [Mangrovimicrobium sediminis]|uniref:RNA methyltransferase n=1 Tax=Mangrovimicrobium sediminis TaxID=2562682 RepID=A0A4Z0M2B5_9GAMM|nr:RNA methyltransferase [Haliea sp. SAOS-164]TGD73577.1 RNA methyltransferase [Haliea sp. SAOS-164]